MHTNTTRAGRMLKPLLRDTAWCGLRYLFFEVAYVAQVKPQRLHHREKDHPSYEQSLVVAWQVMELQTKQI